MGASCSIYTFYKLKCSSVSVFLGSFIQCTLIIVISFLSSFFYCTVCFRHALYKQLIIGPASNFRCILALFFFWLSVVVVFLPLIFFPYYLFFFSYCKCRIIHVYKYFVICNLVFFSCNKKNLKSCDWFEFYF